MAERCLWDDEAVMEVLAPPGGVYKWMHSTMSSKPFSENMKWIPQLCEKAEVSVFCLSIELVCTQTESSSEHRTHWQWCISVAGQPKIYRLCRSVWAVHQIKAKGLALCRPVFLLPTFLSSSAKEDTVLPSAQIQRCSILPPHRVWLGWVMVSHQPTSFICAYRFLIPLLSGFHLNQLVKVDLCRQKRSLACLYSVYMGTQEVWAYFLCMNSEWLWQLQHQDIYTQVATKGCFHYWLTSWLFSRWIV